MRRAIVALVIVALIVLSALAVESINDPGQAMTAGIILGGGWGMLAVVLGDRDGKRDRVKRRTNWNGEHVIIMERDASGDWHEVKD